jgi:two-component sensor histidine kinase
MEGRRDDALLIASELVTNAVLHSSCGADDVLDVCITSDGWLRISVLDPGGSGGAAEIAERPVGLGGLGLKIVQAAADRWGTDRRLEGDEVWAEMRLRA